MCESAARKLAALRSRGGRLFVLGVGGSAANASHAVNDFRKIAGIESYAPTDNVSELTARTNDEGWSSVFREWLRVSRLSGNDGVLVLSVGGGSLEKNVSPNLVYALDLAREVGALILGIVGRHRRLHGAGGRCRDCDSSCQPGETHAALRSLSGGRVAPVGLAPAVVAEHRQMGKPALRRAVFLDRDGVINRALVREGKPYPPLRLEEFEIYPDAREACAQLKTAGFALVVVTNQPEVGRGTLSRATVEAMHAAMHAALPIDRVEVCYEPGDADFYKPATGMLRRAAAELSLDLEGGFMVGDRWRDIDCGRAAGCVTIWIDRGYDEALRQPPHFRTESLGRAAEIILRAGG